VKKQRAQAINYLIRDLVSQYKQTNQFDENAVPPQWKEQALEIAAQEIWIELDGMEEIMDDDDPVINVEALSEITQDVSEDRLVRKVAQLRIRQNYDWQRMMQPQVEGGAAQQQTATQPGAQPSGEQSVSSEVSDLTQQAKAM
jgi:hypothetical protein